MPTGRDLVALGQCPSRQAGRNCSPCLEQPASNGKELRPVSTLPGSGLRLGSHIHRKWSLKEGEGRKRSLGI